ncbi:MAG: hypothetical protein MJK04_17140, partial [Psychrosphaera sp.]|nr:hypothetical protein [Psychrosphaera sp.]
MCTTNGQSVSVLNAGIANVSVYAGVPASQLDLTFGNHLTDAEYYVVRLVNGQPTKVLTGAHGTYTAHNWSAINKEGNTHGVIYSGDGGHGSHLTPNTHRVLVQSTDLNTSGNWSDGWWEFSLSANYSASGTIDVYSLDKTANGGKQWRTWNNVEVFRWSKKDDVEGFATQFPWVKDYNKTNWGSAQTGQNAKIEVGMKWNVGVSKRFCVPFWGPCATLSINKSGDEGKTINFSQYELTDTNGSLKIGRADDMYDKVDKLFDDRATAAGVTSNDEIWVKTKANSSWHKIDGALEQVSVAEDGRMWGVNEHGNVYTRGSLTQGWQHIGTNVFIDPVAYVDANASTVWAIDRNSRTYKKEGLYG